MKPEKILYAMNDIDNEFLNEARETAPRRHSRKFVALLAAVIAVTAMTLTAFAADDLQSWFEKYFSQKAAAYQAEQEAVNGELSQKQLDYIHKNEQVIAETHEANGWTVELKSAIGSGQVNYIILSVTAPENIVLTDWESLSGFDLSNSAGIGFAWSAIMMEDSDRLDNTCDVLVVTEPDKPIDAGQWIIRINSLFGEIYDEEYERELLRTKYAGKTDITSYTHEEWSKIFRTTLLTEGSWDFTVEIPDSGLEQIELVAEPIESRVLVETFSLPGRLYNSHPITVTSFLLRPLDASLSYELSRQDSKIEWPVTFMGNHATVVMKDGTKIALHGSAASYTGKLKLLSDSPIVLSEVDHVLLSDGTKLTVP